MEELRILHNSCETERMQKDELYLGREKFTRVLRRRGEGKSHAETGKCLGSGGSLL
jgi:hypothetical protein